MMEPLAREINMIKSLKIAFTRNLPLFFFAVSIMGLLYLASCSVPQSVIERQPGGFILFQDDFSDPSSGWDQVTSQNGETNYVHGFYRIWVNEPYTDLWANPNLQFKDTRIEVEVTKAGGPEDDVFGVICRSSESGDQYYFFVISSDGYYGIGKVSGQDQKLLSGEKMLPSDLILQGKQTNLLRADCIHDQLIFYVNGQKLAEAQDADYAGGDVGLTAGSFDKPDIDIHFDNLVVTKP
jgi:hypothetical protein